MKTRMFCFIFCALCLSGCYVKEKNMENFPEGDTLDIPKKYEKVFYDVDDNLDEVTIIVNNRACMLGSDCFGLNPNYELVSENVIRRDGNSYTLKQKTSYQATYLVMMLLSSPKVDVDESENTVRIKYCDGMNLPVNGGIVIDIKFRTGETRTFIMQNGLQVFYEKGKEGIYYRMPRVLIKKFYLSDIDLESVVNVHNIKQQLKNK